MARYDRGGKGCAGGDSQLKLAGRTSGRLTFTFIYEANQRTCTYIFVHSKKTRVLMGKIDDYESAEFASIFWPRDPITDVSSKTWDLGPFRRPPQEVRHLDPRVRCTSAGHASASHTSLLSCLVNRSVHHPINLQRP